MIKKIFSLVCLVLPVALSAQVTISAQLPPAGLVQKDQLWNLVLVNNKEDILNVNIRMNVQDAVSGELVMSANTGMLLLSKGVKLISKNDVQPVLYNFNQDGFAKSFLPIGSYITCYQVYSTSEKGEELLGDECIKLNIDPLSPPLLTSPADKSEVITPYPQFSWVPPAPFDMFTNLSYELVLAEVLEGQSPSEAIQQNTPAYSKSNITQPYESYASSFTALQPEKTYAWQVVAKNGADYATKTEVWTFKIKKDSITQLVSLAPFIKLDNAALRVSVAHQGILKMEVINNLRDTSGTFIVRNLSAKGTGKSVVFNIKLPVKTGHNFLEYDMNKYGRLETKAVYEVEYINSNKESFFMKFSPVYYR
jgi:hypothetical protein